MSAASDPDGRHRAGPVETEFLLASGKYVGTARGIGIVIISAFGVLSTPTEALPLAFSLLVGAVVVAAAECVTWVTVVGRYVTFGLTIARAAVICAAQSWTASGAESYHSNEWALNVLTITAITIQWEWRPAVAIPAVFGLLGINVLTAGFGEAVLGGDQVLLVVRVLIECFLARICFRFVLRTTRLTDRLRAEQEALRRQATLAGARRRQEREHLALLHDTVAATLLMAARNKPIADPDELAGYARRDLSVLTGEPGRSSPNGSLVDFTTLLGAVVEQSPLSIESRVECEARLPPGPALALIRALHEALANIDRHAGVRTATLRVTGGECGLVMEVVDTGRGFDPTAVPTHRRGICGSIVERVAAAGGRATVTSQPGAGTLVRLEWADG